MFMKHLVPAASGGSATAPDDAAAASSAPTSVYLSLGLWICAGESSIDAVRPSSYDVKDPHTTDTNHQIHHAVHWLTAHSAQAHPQRAWSRSLNPRPSGHASSPKTVDMDFQVSRKSPAAPADSGRRRMRRPSTSSPFLHTIRWCSCVGRPL